MGTIKKARRSAKINLALKGDILQEKSKQPTRKSNRALYHILGDQPDIIPKLARHLELHFRKNQRLLKYCLPVLGYLDNPESFVLAVEHDLDLTGFSLKLFTRLCLAIIATGPREMANKMKDVLRDARLNRYIPKEAPRRREKTYTMIYLRSNPKILRKVVPDYADWHLRGERKGKKKDKEDKGRKNYQSQEETERLVREHLKYLESLGYQIPFVSLDPFLDKGPIAIARRILALRFELQPDALDELWKRPGRRPLRRHHVLNPEFDTPDMLRCLDAFSKVLLLDLVPSGAVIPHDPELDVFYRYRDWE